METNTITRILKSGMILQVVDKPPGFMVSAHQELRFPLFLRVDYTVQQMPEDFKMPEVKAGASRCLDRKSSRDAMEIDLGRPGPFPTFQNPGDRVCLHSGLAYPTFIYVGELTPEHWAQFWSVGGSSK